MRLEQENDDLAHELVSSKILLRKDLDNVRHVVPEFPFLDLCEYVNVGVHVCVQNPFSCQVHFYSDRFVVVIWY